MSTEICNNIRTDVYITISFITILAYFAKAILKHKLTVN